ncbi:MAG: hypothetical protein MUC99_12065, partial [Anaerolineae bacterium]|nr:hypothetical protein [Anaerolineae bacterium]
IETHLSDACKLNCVRQVKRWRQGLSRLILDTEKAIQGEYLQNLTPLRGRRGFQGSPAEILLREIIQLAVGRDDRATAPAVVYVTLTPVGSQGSGDYAEYPDHPALADFDRSDRKWIAAARSYQQLSPDNEAPEIINAADSDWMAVEDILATEYKIGVQVICG